VLGFAIRGVRRGTIWQVFALVGTAAAIWTAFLVSQWVGAHWVSARPAVVFLVLRWLVAGLAALAVLSLLTWWGEALAGAVKQSPIGWLDRLSGFFVGAGVGAIVASLVLLVALLLPWPRQPAAWASAAHFTSPMLKSAVRACAFGGRYVPGSGWLEHRFQAAARRVRTVVRPS
jgi:uncharacterized membrane protein required for colicin V production